MVVSTCLAVIALRRRSGRTLRWSTWIIPALGSLVSLWIFTEASGEELLWALGSLALGGLVVALQRSRG
jgi:hypothetical protein